MDCLWERANNRLFLFFLYQAVIAVRVKSTY